MPPRKARQRTEVTLLKRVAATEAPTRPAGRGAAGRAKKGNVNATVARTSSKEPAAATVSGSSLKFQVSGVLLCVLAAWILLALVLAATGSGSEHPLGPWLGREMTRFLLWSLGALPALLLPMVLVASGIRLVMGSGPLRNRILLVAMLGWGHLLLAMSLPGLVHPDMSPEALTRRGGALGQLLVQSFFQPIFGSSWLGPTIVLCFTGIGTVLLALRMAPAEAFSTAGGMGTSLWRQLQERLARPALSRVQQDVEDEFLEGGALALGVEPKGRFLDRRIRLEPEDGRILPMPTGSIPVPPPAAPKARQGRTPLVPGAQLAAAAARPAAALPDPSAESALAGKALEVYQNLSEWRPLRPEDLVGLNPLEVRELKRRDEEVRRAAMLNEWEDREVHAQVARRPRIAPEPESVPPPVPGERTAPVERPAKRMAVPEPEELDDVATDPVIEPDAPPRAQVRRAVVPPSPKQQRSQGTPGAAGLYHVPDVSILPDPPPQEAEVDEKELQSLADKLVLQLRNFGVQGKVLQIEPGPVITRFKIELAPGTPVRKISNLSEDLALALKARRIRIQAPIPGESLVGVEIPNPKPETVYIKELLRANQFRDSKMKLPVVLGKDTSGHPAFTDLSRAPHLLIAGQTGSGKSVCINTILSSLLFSQSPEHLRMILIDPKVVELSTYTEIPHLMAPVVTKPEEAVLALKWVAVEMDRRYDVLASAGVRNIAGFNDKLVAGTLPESMVPEDAVRMPYLLVIVDEFADLMMVAGKEVETNVARIAQKARAVGIHMILATQRPSTNVITGVIKANLPTRIAFQVASQIDARTILDRMGAEELLGRGDMLFRGIEAPEAVRIHGAFVSDQEAEAAALAASSQGIVFPMLDRFEVPDELSDDDDGGDAPIKLDSKFSEAARLVVTVRQGSVSMLQRRMEVGFARAGRMMDQLERMGIVGKDRGSKAREVLMDELQVEDLLRRLEEGY